MRKINITVYPRANTDDKFYVFNPSDDVSLFDPSLPNVNKIYALNNISINYSIQSSVVTSTLLLSMNQTLEEKDYLKSGQLIEITDNGYYIFQGTLGSLRYIQIPPNESGVGGYYVYITLLPSIYQLALLPVIFDNDQKQQVDKLLGINTSLLLLDITQKVKINALLDYINSNTDYNVFFHKTINISDLPSEIFLMASAGQTRDLVLRSSLDFANTVFYQAENGDLIIRQLDSNLLAPFELDLTNKGYPPLVSYEYTDNALSIPAIFSNYAVIPSELSLIGEVTNNLISYKPSTKYYPRIEELFKNGWFSGQLGHTPINNNILKTPAIQDYINGISRHPSPYIIASQQSGAKDDFITSYQSLLTAKDISQSLVNYASLECTISLDSVGLIDSEMKLLLGKCVNIKNCPMKAGLIATYSRNYNESGSYASFNIVPLGSITGYWKN